MEKGNRRRETGEGGPGERLSYVVGRENAMAETFRETSPLITKIGELMAPATFPSLRSLRDLKYIIQMKRP
jgi:hypothetical protein